MEYIGNISLLNLPKHGFLCSRCTKSSAILPCLDWAKDRAHDAEPVISTFHSEMEDAVLDMLLLGTCPVILVLGRKPYKQLPDKLIPPLEAGRLLVISTSEQARISRSSAQLCNEFVCDNSVSLTFGFLSKSSSLYPLYEKAKQNKKNITLISHV